MTDPSGETPRVIALIDLPALRWQVKRSGGASGQDLSAVIERLEAGATKLYAGAEITLRLELVYVYSPRERLTAAAEATGAAEEAPSDRPLVFKQRTTAGVDHKCWGCYKACTHCKGGADDPGGQGYASPMADDLLKLAREDRYDWAVIVSTDLGLIPVIRYLQSHGRKAIHGCFPPIAMDLTKECWGSIDLRSLDWPQQPTSTAP